MRTIPLQSPQPSVGHNATASAAEKRFHAELRKAVTRDALALDFQPRHNMETGSVSAVEAMLAWPRRRLASPGPLLPGAHSASDRGLMTVLSAWIFRTACAEAAGWERQDLRLSIKLAAPRLRAEDLCLQIAAALDETGLAPERLELSIPESLVFGLEDDADIAFASLRDIGVNLLLDEFGHVFASLTALRAIPLTALKVDRLMLRGLPVDEESLTLVRAVVESAHGLGLKVCADGVDTEAQRAILLALTVDDGQGSVFSPPLSAGALRAYLR
jgi:EAL domain-containing protein (putative c-di-GMP-specific phosphodiesterase class I)